jgi:hypothetical protein
MRTRIAYITAMAAAFFALSIGPALAVWRPGH